MFPSVPRQVRPDGVPLVRTGTSATGAIGEGRSWRRTVALAVGSQLATKGVAPYSPNPGRGQGFGTPCPFPRDYHDCRCI